MEEQTPCQGKILLIRGLWLHTVLPLYVIRTYSLIAERGIAHKAIDLTEDIPWQMPHCMLVQAVTAWLDKPCSCCRAWVVWCSPTHGGRRQCLGLLRPTPALGWPWCLPRPPWCNRGFRVWQPNLMTGNRSKSPIRCHTWGIAITLERGRLLQDNFILGGHHRGQIGAQILDVLPSHLRGPWTHRQIPEEPGLLPTSIYDPQVAPLARSSDRCATSGSET